MRNTLPGGDIVEAMTAFLWKGICLAEQLIGGSLCLIVIHFWLWAHLEAAMHSAAMAAIAGLRMDHSRVQEALTWT